MATRIIEGANTPAHPSVEGTAPDPEVHYLFEANHFADLAGVQLAPDMLQGLVDRVRSVSRGASLLLDVLEQDHNNEEERFFNDNYRETIAGLVRHALDMLADDVVAMADRSKLHQELQAARTGGAS